MFDWYRGATWSNIVASLIWALPTWGFLVYRQAKHHKHVDRSLAQLHAKHDVILKRISKGSNNVIR